jgi:hypothetical protein
VVDDNGSEWLRWLLKQEDVIQGYSNHRDNKGTLGLPSSRHDILHPFKEPGSFLTSRREKGDTDSPGMKIDCSYNLTSKRIWEG